MPRSHFHFGRRVDVLPERMCRSGPSQDPDESQRGLALRFFSPPPRPISMLAQTSRATSRWQAPPLRTQSTSRNRMPRMPPIRRMPSPPTTSTTNTSRAARSSRLPVGAAVTRIDTRSIDRRRALDSSTSRRALSSERPLQPDSPPASRPSIPRAARPGFSAPDRPDRPDRQRAGQLTARAIHEPSTSARPRPESTWDPRAALASIPPRIR